MTTKIWPEKFKLNNKNVVVTGSGLIGSTIIRSLAEVGAKVIFGDINEKKGKELEVALSSDNLNVIYQKLDIGEENSINTFMENVCEELKEIHGWVNTAYPRTKDWGKKDQLLDFTSWKRNIEMHLGGYYLTSVKAAEIMKKQNNGSIVNFSSIYGITAPDFSIYEGTDMTVPIPYAAIKGGINMVTKYIASYYGKYNVRANIIAPGGVFDNQSKSFKEKYEEKVPLKRMAYPEDIAGPVIFLISDASSYITGHVLVVDGGWTTI